MIAGDVNAYQVFARARSVWSAEQYPRVVDYTVRVTGTTGGRAQVRHYHEYWVPQTGRIYVQPPVSDEQLAHPYKPSAGVEFMKFWNIGGPRVGTGVKDLIDVPVLAPNYSFGIASYTAPAAATSAEIVAQVRREFHDPAPQKVAALQSKSGLKTIALVSSVAREYKISFVGMENIDGHADYHLAFQPLHDPAKYRLRDAWIAEATYLTDRLRVQGNFQDHAMAQVPWQVNYRTDAGVTYISEEHAEQPIQGYRSTMYESFSVAFDYAGAGASPFWAVPPAAGASFSEP